MYAAFAVQLVFISSIFGFLAFYYFLNMKK
jgi:hypothetical protein